MAACGILVLWPGIELTIPTLEAKSLNHWTTKEILDIFLFWNFLNKNYLHNPGYIWPSNTPQVRPDSLQELHGLGWWWFWMRQMVLDCQAQPLQEKGSRAPGLPWPAEILSSILISSLRWLILFQFDWVGGSLPSWSNIISGCVCEGVSRIC